MSTALIRTVSQPAETPTFRAPPHNFEAEQALLGAILVNNEACDRVSGFLRAEHFYDALHGLIYDHAAKLIRAGKRATPITLKTFFRAARDRSAISRCRNISAASPPTPPPSSTPRIMAAPSTTSPSAGR